MYRDKFIDLIMKTGNYRPYSAAPCFELSGKSFTFGFEAKDDCKLKFEDSALEYNGKTYEYSCAKCDDSTYLVGFDGKSLFIDAAANKAVFVADDKLLVCGKEKYDLTGELAGWKTTLCFAPGLTVACEFGKDVIRYDGGELSMECFKVGEAAYLVSAASADGRLIFVMDTARFLFYGLLAGKTSLGGYIENPLD